MWLINTAAVANELHCKRSWNIILSAATFERKGLSHITLFVVVACCIAVFMAQHCSLHKRLFHAGGPATAKARSPSEERRVAASHRSIAVSTRCHSACCWSNVAPSTAVCIVIRSRGASNTSFISWGQSLCGSWTMHEHGTVYLSSSPTARHLSPSRNISRLIYSDYLFRARIRLLVCKWALVVAIVVAAAILGYLHGAITT